MEDLLAKNALIENHVTNIAEVEKSESTEIVSDTDTYRELQKAEESSLLFWGEGAVNKSSGFEENCYMDGTNLDASM